MKFIDFMVYAAAFLAVLGFMFMLSMNAKKSRRHLEEKQRHEQQQNSRIELLERRVDSLGYQIESLNIKNLP